MELNCPLCGEDLTNTVRDAYSDLGGRADFEVECPRCEKELLVSANVSVHFSVSDPAEAYRQMLDRQFPD
jgi:rRNA maturation protein Nop10